MENQTIQIVVGVILMGIGLALSVVFLVKEGRVPVYGMGSLLTALRNIAWK